MAQYNRRAEGRRPPHRGRSDRESAVLGEIRDAETIPLGNDYHTEKRAIGNDNVRDGICRWRGRKS